MKQHKKALVTGASHGIGRGIAEELAAREYDLAVSYHHGETAARELREELEKKYPVHVYILEAALEEKTAAEKLLRSATEKLEGLDLLVNNAGMTRFEALEDLSGDTLDLLLSLDFRTYIVMMREAARYMIARGRGGCIINITSSRSERAYPGDGVYGACKAGLNRAAESFALDLAPYGIRVNNVAPGSIAVRSSRDGEETYQRWKPVYDRLGRKIPLGRMGRPEDVAKAVAFLASEDASYITGITLRVDGGLILPGMPEYETGADDPWGQKWRGERKA